MKRALAVFLNPHELLVADLEAEGAKVTMHTLYTVIQVNQSFLIYEDGKQVAQLAGTPTLYRLMGGLQQARVWGSSPTQLEERCTSE